MPIFQSAMYETAGEKSYDEITYIRLNNTPNAQALQEKLAAMPSPDFGTLKFGTMTSREFVLYRSELMRGGSRYTKIGHFPLT